MMLQVSKLSRWQQCILMLLRIDDKKRAQERRKKNLRLFYLIKNVDVKQERLQKKIYCIKLIFRYFVFVVYQL
jgi:hypothetical protein